MSPPVSSQLAGTMSILLQCCAETVHELQKSQNLQCLLKKRSGKLQHLVHCTDKQLCLVHSMMMDLANVLSPSKQGWLVDRSAYSVKVAQLTTFLCSMSAPSCRRSFTQARCPVKTCALMYIPDGIAASNVFLSQGASIQASVEIWKCQLHVVLVIHQSQPQV